MLKVYAENYGPPAGLSRDIARIERVGRRYRYLVLLVGLQILAVFGLTALISVVSAGGAQSGSLIETASAVVRIGLFVAGMVVGYQLADAFGEKNPGLWAAGMLIPLLNLVVLALLSSKASELCRRSGVRVGLLGPTGESLRQLRQPRR